MHIARSIAEWVAFAVLRLAATCWATAGVAMLAAGGAVQAAGAGANGARLVFWSSVALAVALLFAGGVSLYLRRAATTWLPDASGSEQSAGSGFDGWLILFPLTLVGVPALMLVQLLPLAVFWRDVLALADRLDFWPNLLSNSQNSGWVLVPIFSALSLPTIDVAAAAATVVGSAMLITLLLVRSTHVPRALLMWMILQGGLVLASVIGAFVVDRLTPSIEQLVRSVPDPDGVESARIMSGLQRYGAVVQGASEALAWSWGAILVWVPLLALSVRGRAAFAAALGAGESLRRIASNEPNYAAMDDQARERAYRDVARQVDRTTKASRWF